MINELKPKTFTLRLGREHWAFIKKLAIDNNTSMNDLIVSLIEMQKNKFEKKNLKELTEL